MGLQCKQVGKFKSIMTKMNNELEAQKRVAKEKKDKKGKKQVI